MAVVISSSRARVEGSSSAEMRCEYVRVVCERESGRRERSWSFWRCWGESLGRLDCAGRCQQCCIRVRQAGEAPVCA